ncbi:MAG: 30S ribosomal protein S13 [Candidatus Nanoarchaeia archaeon]
MAQEALKPFQRVLRTDLDGNLPISRALLKINGIGFALSNAICTSLKMDRSKKAGLLSDQEVQSIEVLVKERKQIPTWMFNRKADFETGEHLHLVGPDLKLAQEFDVKRMKKIRCYKGMRHAIGQPVRGQRTRSHFRKGSAVGVLKSKTQGAAKPAAAKDEKGKK